MCIKNLSNQFYKWVLREEINGIDADDHLSFVPFASGLQLCQLKEEMFTHQVGQMKSRMLAKILVRLVLLIHPFLHVFTQLTLKALVQIRLVRKLCQNYLKVLFLRIHSMVIIPIGFLHLHLIISSSFLYLHLIICYCKAKINILCRKSDTCSIHRHCYGKQCMYYTYSDFSKWD